MKRIVVLLAAMIVALGAPTIAGANGVNESNPLTGTQPFEDDEGGLGFQGECTADAENPSADPLVGDPCEF